MKRTTINQTLTKEQVGNTVLVYSINNQLKKQCIAAYQK